MSRIGKQPVMIPAGVTVTSKDNVVTVKGPKGELTQEVNPKLTVEIEDNQVVLTRANDSGEQKAQHGLYRSLINNMVEGVSKGFVKKMELVGVGYRATNQGQILELSLGYSHPIHMQLPSEIKVEAVTDRKSNPIITLESADKQLLGQVCAKIRSLRKPEPYKGKGVRFVGEQIRRKAGKSAKV
ncbi:50S ribosomal protein L6 [Saccharicrinis aurantiacus]|uniref:50S ribosomal protein L6 n=1 Tax=Saccharicrinis aurantiacus TaxID=1849719 RepID=UPI000839408C|nr:50S ribosomal protein L6 [Saccharicrinis aurantiacus]